MPRATKKGIFISEEMLVGMRIALSGTATPIDALIQGLTDRASQKQTSKAGARGKDTYFLRPVKANDVVREMMAVCINKGVDLVLRHTYDMNDGAIVTCQSDVRSLLTAYIKSGGLDGATLVTLDDLIWSGLSDEYKESLRTKGVLVSIGDSLCIRKDKGVISSLASEIVRHA